MAGIEDGLKTLLDAESTLTAICGTRIYPDKAPQTAAFPQIVFTQLNSDELNTLDGGADVRSIDLDFDCRANRSVTAVSLRTALRDYIRDFTGSAGTETINSVTVNGDAADYEPPVDGSDNGVFVKTLDVQIHYTPA
jgi:hypothetical protein